MFRGERLIKVSRRPHFKSFHLHIYRKVTHIRYVGIVI